MIIFIVGARQPVLEHLILLHVNNKGADQPHIYAVLSGPLLFARQKVE